MNLALRIARRYLIAKKSTNVINFITGISVLGITIGTAAIILILSVFNGLEGLISGMFNSFNPTLKITAVEGKSFEEKALDWTQIRDMDGIAHVSKTLEELVLFEHEKVQEHGFLKGVDSLFRKVNTVDKIVRSGQFKLVDEASDYGVFGVGLARKLDIQIRNNYLPVKVYALSRSQGFMSNTPYKSQRLYPSGNFSVQDEEDNKYVFCDLNFLQALTNKRGRVSAVEISLNDNADVKTIKNQLKDICGDSFLVRDQYEQDATFIRVMKIEKWLSYAIACFTLLLIAFNMVGALWMIVLEKRPDLSILKSMGMTTANIQSIFIYVGMLITLIGFVLGSIIAVILYYLQITIGLVPIPPGSIIDTYPVEMKATDFVIVFFTVMSIGLLASILPAKRAGETASFLRET